MKIDFDEMISIDEAAQALQVSTRTIRNWLDQGTFVPAFRFGRRCLRFKASDVQKFIQQHSQNIEVQ